MVGESLFTMVTGGQTAVCVMYHFRFLGQFTKKCQTKVQRSKNERGSEDKHQTQKERADLCPTTIEKEEKLKNKSNSVIFNVPHLVLYLSKCASN